MSELREGAGSGSSRLIPVLFFFPFLCRVAALSLSGIRLFLFGGASDDEQGSKEGDYRRGKFHRIAFVGFCCKEVKHPNSGLRLVPVPPQLGPRRARLSFALHEIGYRAQTNKRKTPNRRVSRGILTTMKTLPPLTVKWQEVPSAPLAVGSPRFYIATANLAR